MEKKSEKSESKKQKAKRKAKKDSSTYDTTTGFWKKKNRRRFTIHAEAESIADRAKFFFFSLKAHALRHIESDVVDWISN